MTQLYYAAHLSALGLGWFSVLICLISARNSISIRGRSPREFQKRRSRPMPMYQRFGPDDRNGLRKPSIHLDEETSDRREMSAALHLTSQDHQLMSERGILSLKPDLRLEGRGQESHDETHELDHSASLDNSITSATRIRFSVQTAPAGSAYHCDSPRCPDSCGSRRPSAGTVGSRTVADGFR
jgi:hypothetical protein